MLRQRRSEKEDSSYRLLFKDYFGGKLKKKKEYFDLRDEDRVVSKRSDRAKYGSF